MSWLDTFTGNNNPNDPTGGNSNSPSNTGGMSTSDWLNWTKFLYGVEKQSQGPKFTNTPMSPQEKQIYDLYYGKLTDPASLANAQYLKQFASNHMAVPTPQWTSPGTFDVNGAGIHTPGAASGPGYAGNGAPGGGGGAGGGLPGGAFDWSKYPTSGIPGATPTGQVGGTATSAASGVPGPSVPGSSGIDHLPDTSASSGVSAGDIASFVNTYGKPALTTATGLLSANPLLAGMGLAGIYMAWKNHQLPADAKIPDNFGGPQDTQTDALHTFTPIPGNPYADMNSPTAPTVQYGNDPWNNPGFSDFGHDGGAGGTGRYDDSRPGPLPGSPRYGGGPGGGGLA